MINTTASEIPAVLIGWAAKIGEADAAPIGEFCVFGFGLPCMN